MMQVAAGPLVESKHDRPARRPWDRNSVAVWVPVLFCA